jgi:prolyl oligopeptidase
MPPAEPVPPPPPAPRQQLVEVLHGIEVADPFRSLEDGAAPGTRAWVRAQNERTEAALARLEDRERLRWRLRALLSAGSSVSCAVAGDRVFSLERWAPHDQAVLVVRPAAEPGPARTIVDPLAGAGDDGDADATAAIDWYSPSPDGRLVAYGRSTGGDERSTLHLVDVDTGGHRGDRIPRTRACSVAWLPDGSAFAYTRYPDPGTVPAGEEEYWRKVYRHRVGDDWRHDEVVWGELPDPTAFPTVEGSPDGRWLLVHLSLGWSRVDVHLVEVATGARTVMVEGLDAVSTFTVVGDRVVGHTTLGADRGRVVAAPLTTPWHERWETVVPEGPGVIEAVAATAGSLLVLSSHDAVSHLDRYDLDGGGHRPVALPELGSLAGLDGSRRRDEAFFSFTSFTRPPTLFRWHPDDVSPWSHRPGDPVGDAGDAHDAGAYEVEQLRYPAPDGTDIPLLVVRAAATVAGPDTPCVLSAYGGFGINMAPAYSAAVVAVCDDGGLYAVPAIRGGGERGESWHEAGKRERKQTSFDDFLAAADWLVERGWTSRRRLAIRGGSNGGLLMGAAVTQRPDLCRAVQIAVPLADMVRFPRFLIARLWIPEYGDPDHPAELRWLHAYSPYHRVVDGTCYPAVILTTAEEDSRVDPLHARKLAARLQEATSCGDARPILLREETHAGHGQGKPVSKQAEELADVLAFLRWQLDWPAVSPAPRPP